MPGFGDFFSNLASNKFIQQLMLTAGPAISAGENPFQALGQAGVQNIAGQNQSNLIGLFGKMLRGEIPDGGKLSMDKDGMKLNIPSMHYKPDQGPVFSPGPVESPTGGGTGVENTEKTMLSKLLNPSKGQPLVSASDVAGLSPTDISNALSGALGVEGLKQKSKTDVIDIIYKMALTKKALRDEPLDRNYPISVPGVGRVSLREWQSLPIDERQYAAYVHTAKVMGDSDIMSKKEFDTLKPTDRQKFLEYLMAHPEAMAAEKELRESGRTLIDQSTKIETAVKTAVEKQKALNKLKGKAWMSDPGWVDEVSDHLNEKDVSRKINLSDDPDKARAAERIRYIQSKIKGGGGKIVKVEYSKDDNRVLVWTIKWPDGSEETKEYAVWD